MKDVYVVERWDSPPGEHKTLVERAFYNTEADAQKYVESLGPLSDCNITHVRYERRRAERRRA